MATQTFRKWGNSLAVRIPAEIVAAGHFQEGQRVEVQVVDGALTLRPHDPVYEFSMARYRQQLRQSRLEMTPTLEWGPPRGSEVGGPDDPTSADEW